MKLPAGEPPAGPWRAVDDEELLHIVSGGRQLNARRPWIVAVDGRGASGKSTLADRLANLSSRSAVVHTDDIAWNEPLFAWGDLLAHHVLEPLRRGEEVSFSPPAWRQHARDGAIEIAVNLDLVIVEGVGASQRLFARLVDATVWVQSDFEAAERRGIARDVAQGANGDAEEATAFWHEWMAAELRFLAEERPWERACVVVAGSETIPLAPGEVAIVPGPLTTAHAPPPVYSEYDHDHQGQ